MRGHRRGFTLVEIIVCIAIIAMLVVLSLFAYRGYQQRAENTSRFNELKAWEKLYRLYAATYREWPQYPGSPDGDGNPDGSGGKGYCLGTGFPDTDGSGRGNCRDTTNGYWDNTAGGTTYHTNTDLNNELKRVGSLPGGIRKTPSPGNRYQPLGPFARYFTGGNVIISNIFDATSCPSGTSEAWRYDDRAIMCELDLGKAR